MAGNQIVFTLPKEHQTWIRAIRFIPMDGADTRGYGIFFQGVLDLINGNTLTPFYAHNAKEVIFDLADKS